MEQYVGLDVSQETTSIAVRQDGRRVWRGKCPTDPKALSEVIRKHAPHAVRVVFETGALATWLYHVLQAENLPVVCIDARHAKAALDMAPNKTDANDADGLAQIAEIGFYREVRVKGYGPMLTRTLVGAQPAAPHLGPALQPDPRDHEDLRPDRAERGRSHLRAQRSRAARDE